MADDGSTDRTAEIVAGYGDEVRFVTEETAGPAATRNLGLAAATGEYVAFLDGDDLWHEEKLARQMARLETEPVPDACVTHVQHFWMPELADEEAKLRDQPRGQVVSYCQKLCMGLSCGGAILAFSIDEFDASNDLGELI